MPRLLEPADRERCLALAARVGWPREPVKWDLLFELGPVHGIDESDGSLAAMVATPRHEGAAFVAMMVVDPAHQGRGLGRALLARAMTGGVSPLLLYATEAGRPLYERLGFRAVDAVHKHVGRLRTSPRAAGTGVAPDWSAIEQADAAAFGFGRGPLLRALRPRVVRVATTVDGGFALRWSNGHLDVVGPVVAADEGAAIALVEQALEGCAGAVRVDVAADSSTLRAHLRGLGLDDLGPAPLMTWPEPIRPGARERYHAIALQAFG